MNVLHIMPDDKFTQPFIDFVNSNFNSKEHTFIIINNSKNNYNQKSNVINLSLNFINILLLITKMNKFKQIIIHGLGNRKIVQILFLQPWLLHKSNWVIWGGDLYYHETVKDTFKSNVYELLRKQVIRNMGGLITHIKGDYELTKKWYRARGKYFYCFMYPSNLYREYDLNGEKDRNKIYIQIGNSADPSNNHIEVFRKLEKYNHRNIQIICPLSYGDKEYRDKVINEGKIVFGNKFEAITEFIPFNKYLDILAKIDIAIFNHNRQQAMGNITTLLGLGKKVYIRDDISTWDFFIEHELMVFNSNSTLGNVFQNLDDAIKYKNINNVKKKFSEEKLKEDWNRIFSYGEKRDE